MSRVRALLRCAVLLFLSGGISGSAAIADDAEALVHFEKHVRPLLVKHCYECHSRDAKRLEGNLYLDRRSGLVRGGDSGSALTPAALDSSLLLQAVRYETYEMPPRGKLSDADIAHLERWVKSGAPWPKEEMAGAPVREQGFDWKRRKQQHWSWQPVTEPTVPTVEQVDWPRNEIDNFILAKLQQQQMKPAPPAKRHEWVRRVYFDLTGLPPTAEQTQAALADTRPDAEARLVDELLSSPHFGEKWARHWMDLVRYAETYGHEFDYPIPHAYQYRDYLIRALNADVPYNQLLREHVAGDLLANPRRHVEHGGNESVIGTGFWFLGEALHAPTDVRGDLSTRIENQIDVFSRAFLGLSVACARCHDHKFDPISKEDYYALYGILNSSHRAESWIDPHQRIEEKIQQLERLQRQAGELLVASLQNDPLLKPGEITRDFRALHPLLAQSGNETPSAEQLQQLAEKSGSDAQRLQRWIDALRDPFVQSPSHPASILVSSLKRGMQPDELKKSFTESRELAAKREMWEQNAVRLDGLESSSPRWRSTGEAFRQTPVQGIQFRSDTDTIELLRPMTWDSGRLSSRLRGSIRSPIFILDQPNVHVLVNARNATLRVVIENYFMDHYQPLLFRDVTKKAIDTKGEWNWVTLSGDLKNHQGRRAYFEILDEGDGEASVAEIWMTAQAAPSTRPSAFAMRLGDGDVSATPQDLASQIESAIRQAVLSTTPTEATPDAVALLNWLLKHKLLEGGSSVRDSLAQLAVTSAAVPHPVAVLSMVEGDALDEPVHIRGSDENFGEVVPRRFLVAIAGEQQPVIPDGSGRRELAERLVDPANPFYSRVIVNRLWHHLIGRGLVASVDDFGEMGQKPSHPELLDWLATDFLRNQSSMKQTIRKIVLSQTYCMSSALQSPDFEERDPENIWLHRMNVRRLPAESIRDGLLTVSGRLDRTMGGPGVRTHMTEFMQGRGRPKDNGPLDGDGRRSVYIEIRRNFLSPFLLTFDMPSPFSCMGRRATSNVPSQPLILMNDPFVAGQAAHWASQSLNEPMSPTDRIGRLFLQAFSRVPDAAESQAVLDFLEEQAQEYNCQLDDVRVWADLCHVLFNRKEFYYLK